DVPAAAANRIRQPRVGNRQVSPLEIKQRVADRAVVLLQLPLVEDRVRRRQDAGRRESLRRIPATKSPRSNQLARKGAVQRRRDTLPRHVPNRDDETVGFRSEEVVEVAAKTPGRREPRRDGDTLQPLRQLTRQERGLHALGEPNLLLETHFVCE